MTRPKGVATREVEPDSVQKVRVRYRCVTCHAVASFTYRNKKLRREVVFDTSNLHCQKCFDAARDEAAAEFFEV